MISLLVQYKQMTGYLFKLLFPKCIKSYGTRGVRQIHTWLKVKPLSATSASEREEFGEEEQLLHEQSKIWDRPHLKKWPKQVEDPSQVGMGTGSQMVLKYLLNEWSDVFQKEANYMSTWGTTSNF